MNIFSDRVRNLRKSYGLSQQRFAKRLGISRDYLSQLENGRQPSKALQMLIETYERSGIGDADSVGKFTRKPTSYDKKQKEIDPACVEEDAKPIIYRSSDFEPPPSYSKLTRADLEADFSYYLDKAEEAGALTHVKIQMSKHFDPADFDHLKPEG